MQVTTHLPLLLRSRKLHKMSHIGVLTVFVGVCSVLCFAEQNFQIIIERVEVVDVDPEIVTASIGVTKYNRTCKTISANFTLLKELGYDVKIDIEVYALYSNEYRRTPILYTRELCDFYKMEFLWVKDKINKYSNFPSNCPLRAGDYYVKDFLPDGSNIPAAANLPWTSIMLYIRTYYKGAIYFSLKAYLTLDHDVELKRLG